MAVKTLQYTVGTTRTAVTIPVDDQVAGTRIWIYGEFTGEGKHCSIGGADVTVANGVHLYAKEKFGPLDLQNGETIYLISDDIAGLEIRILAIGA